MLVVMLYHVSIVGWLQCFDFFFLLTGELYVYMYAPVAERRRRRPKTNAKRTLKQEEGAARTSWRSPLGYGDALAGLLLSVCGV